MKVAIVCDWLVTIGGAEKVLASILSCYPNAELFAVVDFLPPAQRDFLMHKPVRTSFLQKFPLANKYYRHYLPFMPLAIEQIDLSAYDLILSSSHAVAKGVITGPDQLHISYIHSPMRYAWDMQFQYLRETGLDTKWRGYLVRYLLHRLRLWDVRSVMGVDYLIANSHYIAKRILKCYRRQATVIYPPIDTQYFVPGEKKEDFYLTASRLVPYKRIDLIVESFAAMPDKKLVVIGQGPHWAEIKKKMGGQVELLGYQPNEILLSYLQRAKAFIFAAEEDFGLLPLEAQACGTPVIAYSKGGAAETVRGLSQEAPTGIFFNEQTVAAVCAAVELFESNAACFQAEYCVAQAAGFSEAIFQEKLLQFVQSALSKGIV